MTSAELDRLWQDAARKVVLAEITSGPGPLSGGAFDQKAHVIATLDDGRQIELFSFYAHERSFVPEEFVGLTMDEARRLKFAPDHRRDFSPRTSPVTKALN
jgi:hypothetical protein